jgi:PAS domain-containing protein
LEKGEVVAHSKSRSTVKDLKALDKALQEELEEKTQTLEAIRTGEVDAIMVSTKNGDQIFTLKGAEEPYRVLFEQLSEGAVTVSNKGTILYCNKSFARMVQAPIEKVRIEHGIIFPIFPDETFLDLDGTKHGKARPSLRGP